MQVTGPEAIREAVLTGTRAVVGVAARSLAEVSDDVSLAQYRVLVLLDSRGPLTMGELAASLDVHPSTVTRVCDVLVDKGLIIRRTPKSNRRGVKAHLATRGRRLVAEAMHRRRELIDQALAQMSAPARTRLARSLTEFAHALGESSDHAWLLGWSVDIDDEHEVDGDT